MNHERAKLMAGMYCAGYTLQQIGAQYKITRERVRQIISRQTEVRAADGGQAVTARRNREIASARMNAKYLKRYGCTFAQWQSLIEIGKCMMAVGSSRYRTPTGAFKSQQRNAAVRGIGWEFNLWQWWQIWSASGKWADRGRGQGYVMCRYGDVGPYSVENVFIAPARENSSEKKTKKSGLPIGVSPKGKRFAATRNINGTQHKLGAYDTPELAHGAYIACARLDGDSRKQRRPAQHQSGYRGVTWHRDAWQAHLYVNGQCEYLGKFRCPLPAHIAYQKAAHRLNEAPSPPPAPASAVERAA